MNISAVDLFCGIGGLAYGLRQAGIKVNAGVDTDISCKYAFEENCNATFINKSVADLSIKEIKELYPKNDIKVLVGCAPCQPFSKYTVKADKSKDNRWHLLDSFAKLVDQLDPDIVSMENVPELLNFKKAPIFDSFVNELKRKKYYVWFNIVYAPDYGIGQKRKRLVLLASKHGEISLIKPTHTADNYKTVKDIIGKLSPIKHGEFDKVDFIHKASKLSDKNLQRIKQSKPGGSWKTDWEEHLILDCHKSKKGKSYGSIYGRMVWNEPSPTMTTFCTGIGNGRFGHPEQDRAISLREAALLQSFPLDYKFVKSKKDLVVRDISRQIGNAVPPRLGEVIGISILEHLKHVKK